MGELVLYVPRGGHPSTDDIARGSAIEGEPRAGAAEVEVYFEGALFGQENMRALADRATHAAGRMLERYATTAVRIVPCDALVAVGTFDLTRGASGSPAPIRSGPSQIGWARRDSIPWSWRGAREGAQPAPHGHPPA